MSLFDDLPFPTFGQEDVEDFPLMDVNNNYLPQPFTNEEDSNGSIFDPDNNLVPPTSEIEDMPIPLPAPQQQASVRMETTQSSHLPTSFAEPMFSAMDPTTTFQLPQPCRPPPNEVAFPIPNIMDEVEGLKSENDVLEQRSCSMEQVQPSPRRQPLANIPVNCQHTPQKPPDENVALDPLTPTTNLKMLMSAASPEIRNRDNMRRMLSEGIRIQQENRREQLYQQHVQAEDFKQEEASRKDKSLGLLCQRFLEILPEFPDPNKLPTISLDTISAQLGVERRRIYDIVNVLESVEMVSRVGKNRYVWNGKTRLAQTLTRLKARALSDHYSGQILRARAHDRQRELNRVFSQHNSNSSSTNSVFRDPEPPSLHSSVRVGMRKEKSLSLISQKFVMLFLATDETLTLELAAKILSDDMDMDKNDSAKFKTKIRRLYDIANILMSLSLIDKVYGAPGSAVKTRKPGFKYVGPCLRQGCDMRECVCSLQSRNTTNTQSDASKKTRGRPPGKTQKKKPFVRHSSFDLICRAASEERERLYGSQPASPVRAPNVCTSRSNEYVIPDKNVLKVEPEPTFSTSAHPVAAANAQKQSRVVKLAHIPYLRLNQLGKTELVITEINNKQHRTVTSLSSNMTSLLPSVKREGSTLIPEAKKFRSDLEDSEISRITDGVPMRVRSTPVHRVSPRALLFDNIETGGSENVKPANEEKKFAKTVRIIPTNMMNTTTSTPNKSGGITLVVRKQTPSQIPASRNEQYTTPVRVIHEKSITPNARATLFQATQAKLKSPKEGAKLLNPRRVSFLRLAQGD